VVIGRERREREGLTSIERGHGRGRRRHGGRPIWGEEEVGIGERPMVLFSDLGFHRTRKGRLPK
jgi:hypothetical protein